VFVETSQRRRCIVSKRAGIAILFLSSVAMILIAASATTIYSSPGSSSNPKLTVESCLVQGTDVFRIRVVNWEVPGEWRLQLHKGTEIIPLGYLEPWEQAGALDWTATITTTTEGTWRKQFLEAGEWVDSHGAHSLSVEKFTEYGWFCPAEPTYDLGDLVWYDTNQDGQQDAGEPGVQGVVVQFYDDPSCGTTYAYSRTSNLGGGYLFTDLTTSTVCLQFLGIPDGWQVTLPDQGGDDAVDSDVDPVSACIEDIDLQGNDLDQDLGLYVDGSLGDRVWCDYDGDTFYDSGEGMQGITVSLFDDLDCDQEGGDLLDSVDTGADGYYSFTDLNTGPPGATDQVCYVVAVDTADEGLQSCWLPATPPTVGLTLTADSPTNEAIDFSFLEQSGLPGPFRTFCPMVSS
jgi:hypothetical protein